MLLKSGVHVAARLLHQEDSSLGLSGEAAIQDTLLLPLLLI
jgi:hypothetical protein